MYCTDGVPYSDPFKRFHLFGISLTAVLYLDLRKLSRGGHTVANTIHVYRIDLYALNTTACSIRGVEINILHPGMGQAQAVAWGPVARSPRRCLTQAVFPIGSLQCRMNSSLGQCIPRSELISRREDKMSQLHCLA